MSQRGALILFIFLPIVGALIGGWFLISKREAAMPSTRGTTESEIFPVAPPETAASDNSTKDWKVYRNEKYGFEFRYSPDWFVEEDKSADRWQILTLRTIKYKETKLSECCPFAVQSAGDEDKVVKIHDGEIIVSASQNAPAYFDQTCPRPFGKTAPEIETISLGSFRWHGCITKREGFSAPQLYIESETPGRYLVFSGGLESEKQNVDLNQLVNYDFVLVEIARSFRFVSRQGGGTEASKEDMRSNRSDSTDVADDWKTYRNEENRFELKIPANWELDVVHSNVIDFSDPNRPLFYEEAPINPVRMTWYQNRSQWNIDSLISSNFNLPFSEGRQATREKARIDGKDVIFIHTSFGPVYELVSENIILRFTSFTTDRQVIDRLKKILTTVWFK